MKVRKLQQKQVLRILQHLPAYASYLSNRLKLSQQAVSKQLIQLEKEGFVYQPDLLQKQYNLKGFKITDKGFDLMILLGDYFQKKEELEKCIKKIESL